MADGSTTTQSSPYKAISLAEVDRIHECAYQATGILMLLRHSSGNPDVEVPEDALIGACWAAERLVKEMEDLATKKEGQSHG